MTVRWSDLGMKTPSRARDLWAHKDENFQGPAQTASVPAHGVVLWRVR